MRKRTPKTAIPPSTKSTVVGLRMPESEKRRLIECAQAGDETARAKLMAGHMGMIMHVAQRYYRPGMFLELSDLVQQGCLGLLRAIEKFDLDLRSRGRAPAFVTYAMYWVQHAVRREISNRGNCVAVPYRHRKRNSLSGQVEIQTGDPVFSLISLRLTDESPEETSQYGEMVMLPAPSAEDPHAIADLESQKVVIQRWIQVLSVKERYVLDHFYGLNGLEPETPAAIGQTLGVSEGSVHQIRMKAVRRLRRLVDVNRSPYHVSLGPVLLTEPPTRRQS